MPKNNSQNTRFDIRKKILSGEYFADGLRWYDSKYNAPMAERSFLIIITIFAAMIIFFSYKAIVGILPITEQKEVYLITDDVFGSQPSVNPLSERYSETDSAIREFLVTDYVRARESYSVDSLEANYRRVRFLSTPEVFATYQDEIEPANPQSPIILYERHTTKEIRRMSIGLYSSKPENSGQDEEDIVPDTAQVDFTAVTVSNGEEIGAARYRAVINFEYKGIEVMQDNADDESPQEVKPMEFRVTGYNLQRLIGQE
jgi:type IV secretory pathway component VirB8